MKIVADFPAFEVMDLEADLLTLPREKLDHLDPQGLKFCFAKETKRHGTLYPELRPYCAAYYAQDYNEDPVAAEERCDRLGHEKYWISDCAAVISDRKQDKGIRILIKDGQKISMNGKILQVVKLSIDRFKLVEVVAAE